MRHKLQPWDMEHKELAQTWALISMDVAYDTANNAYVLDVNARPAPTGNQHPLWYLECRGLHAHAHVQNEYEHAHLINDMRTEMHLTRCTVCRYTKDRSATIREAVDILQEASV